MSLDHSTVRDLWCDRVGCFRYVIGRSGDTEESIRVRAAARGWRVIDDEDRCPEHVSLSEHPSAWAATLENETRPPVATNELTASPRDRTSREQ